METTMKHISVDDRKLNEVQEIADREGRQDTDCFREAIAQWIRNKEDVPERVHSSAPGESVVRSGDKVVELDFQEMWIEHETNRKIESVKSGEIIRALEISNDYFTFYNFIYDGDYYICNNVARMKHDLVDEIYRRINRYQI